jgi:hypothetical protein
MLEAIVLKHPRIFPDFVEGSIDFDSYPPVYRQGEIFRDNWGCLWRNTIGGLEGQVVESPLVDWTALDAYRPPDPAVKAEREDMNWGRFRRDAEEKRAKGRHTMGLGGRLFDRMYFLRGFENLMMDFATDDHRLRDEADPVLPRHRGGRHGFPYGHRHAEQPHDKPRTVPQVH